MQPLQFANLIQLVAARGCQGKLAIEDDSRKLRS